MKPLALALFASALCSVTALTACNRQAANAGDGPAPSDTETESPQTETTAQDAIQVVRELAERGALKTTVQRRYKERRQQRVPCSQVEVEMDRSAHPNNPELWRCKSTGGMTYMKNAWVEEDKCCKVEQRDVPPDIMLTAEYSNEDQKWHVMGDQYFEGVEHHFEWTVDQQNREVSPREQ